MYDLNAFLSLMHPGDVGIDVGANVGDVTRRMAERVGPSGLILAAEPDPETYATLRDRMSGFPQVRPLCVAVTDADDQTRSLTRDSEDRRRSTLWPENTIKRGERVDVRTATLDLLDRFTDHRTRFVKIDAQGAEGLILAGAFGVRARPDVTWFVEFWAEGLKQAGSSVRAVAEWFASEGFVPVGRSWDAVIPGVEKKQDHGAADILIRHRSVVEAT